MPSNNCEHVGKLLRKLHCSPATLQISSDTNNFFDSCPLGPLNDLGQFLREIRIIEMSVGIVKNRLHKRLHIPSRRAKVNEGAACFSQCFCIDLTGQRRYWSSAFAQNLKPW